MQLLNLSLFHSPFCGGMGLSNFLTKFEIKYSDFRKKLQPNIFICPELRWGYYVKVGVRICNKRIWIHSVVHSFTHSVSKICHHVSGHSFCPICIKFGTQVCICDA